MFETHYGERLAAGTMSLALAFEEAHKTGELSRLQDSLSARARRRVSCATLPFLFHNLGLICSCSRRASKAPSVWGLFVIERDAPGVTIADEVDLTTDATVARLMLQHCKIPNEQLLGYEYEAGADHRRRTIEHRGAIVGHRHALSGGVHRACAQPRDLRPPLGRAPSDSMDAGRPVDRDQRRCTWLTLEAAWRADQELPYFEEAALAKKRAAKMAFNAADTAIQIHGGYGVCKEFPFEGFYREARLMRLLYGREEELDRAVGEKFLRQ